jgi:uncharacterized protein YbjT (DUF2867 family)
VQATVAALAGSRVRRVAFLSFPGADPRSSNPYLRAKAQAEVTLREGEIPTTILRCHHQPDQEVDQARPPLVL